MTGLYNLLLDWSVSDQGQLGQQAEYLFMFMLVVLYLHSYVMHYVCLDSFLVEPWLMGATCKGKGKEKINEP